MKTNTQPYDIIGDIHGHADKLRALLTRLDYVECGGVYRHRERIVIFVGDFIDRGPKIRETLQIVRAMVDAGTAHAVMGNHEYNALCFHTGDGHGGYLRSHTAGGGKNVEQHRATLDQIALPMPEEWAKWLTWFKALPLFLELEGLRVVHACWDDEQIAFLKGDNRLSDELLFKSAVKDTPEYRAIEVLLKGKEVALPDGHTFITKEGHSRHEIRVKWWIPGEGKTYHELSLPSYDTAPKLPVPFDQSLEAGYDTAQPPVFIGHYWLPLARPAPLAPNIGCVDYSVAKPGGMLVAYRWDGEAVLDASKFATVPRLGAPPIDLSCRPTAPAAPGQPAREDYEYERNGVAAIFCAVAPHLGWRFLAARDRKTRCDYAAFLRSLADEHFPDAECIVLVQDNLNTHSPASLYEAFAPAEAARIKARFEFHFTPKHGSWMNIAEIELSALARGCLARRIADRTTLAAELQAWQCHRNQAATGIRWQFTTTDAHIKLIKLYPSLNH